MLTFALFHGWWLLHTLGMHPAWSDRLYIDYSRDTVPSCDIAATGLAKCARLRERGGKGFVSDDHGQLRILLFADHTCRWFVIDHGSRRRIRGTVATCEGEPLGRFVGLRQVMHREVGR